MTKAHMGSYTGASGVPLAIDYQDILFPLEKHRYSNRGHSPVFEICGVEPDDKFGSVLTFNSARTNGMGNITKDYGKLANLFKTAVAGSGTVFTAELPVPFRPVNAGIPMAVHHKANVRDSYCGMLDESGVSYTHGSPSKLPISPGQPYTFSIWAKGAYGGETIELILFDYPGDNAFYGGYLPLSSMFTLTPYWKRYSLTSTGARPGSTRCWGRCDVETAGDTVFWLAPQIEAKAYPTTFVPGAQSSSSSLTYSIPFPTQAFTVNCWVKLHAKLPGYQPVFEVNNGNHQGSRVLFMFSSGANNLMGWIGNATSETNIGYDFAFEVGTWYMLSLTYDGSKFRMFVNGTKVSELATNITPSFLSGYYLNIGGRHWGTLEGAITDFLVSPRGWSPAELEAVYKSGCRLQDPYKYTEGRWMQP